MHAEVLAQHPSLPEGLEHRKMWEMAMEARALRDFGVLRDDAEVLGVGAGSERTTFWLTRHARRVFATDLYFAPGDWGDVAPTKMVIDPLEVAPAIEWRPRRLVAQHMDALDLRYEDESFDGVFCSSSIEHFGSFANVARAAQEMCRVLRPGGIAAISTEYRLEGGSPGLPGTLLFDEDELRTSIVDAADWVMVDELDVSVPSSGLDDAVPFEEAAAGIRRYPHVTLWLGDHVWTSVHLAFQKLP